MSVRSAFRRLFRTAPRPARRRPAARLSLGELEGRAVPAAFGPLGHEFPVNTFTTGNQGGPAVAADAAGNFVAVWESLGQDGPGYGVYARRYAADGTALGGEFPVNSTTANDQGAPAVAVDAAGNFVVVWRSFFQDGSGYGVYARRFAADGTALGGEIPVNTFTAGDQSLPAVAADAAGNFVVAWQSFGQDGSGYGVYARQFSAVGAPLGGEIPVNTTTANAQGSPAVAVDAAGNFVVAWQSFGQDGSQYAVYARQYTAAGTPAGGEFRVNTFTTGDQWFPAVAAHPAGNFVVAWESFGQDGSGTGVYARQFDAAGAPLGEEFLVSTTTANDQWLPAVGVDAAGNFVVAWQSLGQDGAGWGVYARQFAADGAPLGGEIPVNTYTAGDQWYPALAVDPAGNFMVAWQSEGQDGSGSGVYAQRFGLNDDPTVSGVPASATIDELAPYGFTATAADPDDPAAVRFSLVGVPAGAAIDPLTGAFTWTPTEEHGPGTYAFTVRVVDTLNTVDSPVTLTVREVNLAPALGGVPATAATVTGAPLAFTATATDPDLPAQPLTFSLVGAPAGATIHPTSGAFSWTPGPEVAAGDYTFQVRVEDSGTPLGTDTATVTVRVDRMAVLSGDLVVGGTGGNDVITVLPAADPAKLAVRVNGTVAGEFALADVAGRIVVRGLGGNDKVTVDPTLTVGADLWGGAGQDSLYGGAGADSLWGGAGNDRLAGGAGDDRYLFADGRGADVVTETATGGTDTLDLSASVAGVTVIIGGSVRATAGADTMTASRVENIIGGSGGDTFKFAAGGKVVGTIDGGPGADVLNYAPYLTPVTVNLTLGAATGTAGVSSIENAAGGAGADTLVGDGQANALTGNGGRDVLIGAGGADALVGGAGDDLLIGGSTAHDANPTALADVRKEWVKAVPYNTRVATLVGGLLAPANWTDDLAADGLTGAGGLDWFLTFTGDGADAVEGVETVTAH